jgi:hypothetical protein
MRLLRSAIGRPNKRLLALILIVIALTASSTACENSAGAANVVSITAPDSTGEGADTYSPEQLVVKLKPNSSTRSNYGYVVDLYEKGKLRDTSSVFWDTPDLNMKNAEYVYFDLSYDEFQAYSVIARVATRDEFIKFGYGFVFKDLQSTFSVKVAEYSP